MALDVTVPVPHTGGNMSEETLTRIMTAAITAARAPSPEEAATQEETKKRLAHRRMTMLRLVETEQKSILRRQALCSHRKPDGEVAMGGQPMANGRMYKICLRCQKVLVDEPTQEMTLAVNELQRQANEGKMTISRDGKVTVADVEMQVR